MPVAPRPTVALLVLLASWGCGSGERPEPAPSAVGDPAVRQALSDGLGTIINDASLKYAPLTYEYDEDLLATIDRIEARVSGRDKADAPAVKLMPGLDSAEGEAHFRETIRRWSAKTGKDLRAEIDRLKAVVAARKQGDPASRSLRKEFSAVFDDFIRIEVEEMRERRNRAIHEAAAPLLDKYRGSEPALVRENEAMLDAPPYNLPTAQGQPPGPGTGEPRAKGSERP